MRPIRLLPLLLAATLALPACTFVKMAPGADEVSVVALGRTLPDCEKRGEIEVSVKDRLGPYERDELRVRDELETLARNEAPSLAADTVQPKAPPADGEQRFRPTAARVRRGPSPRARRRLWTARRPSR